jgi:hypothetical protein
MTQRLLFLSFIIALAQCGCAPTQTLKPTPSLDNPHKEQFFKEIEMDVNSILATTKKISPQDPILIGWESETQRLSDYTRQWLPRLGNKTIHVILQNHGDVRYPELDKQMEASQKEITETLSRIQPKLLGLEGSFADNLTKEAYTNEIVIGYKKGHRAEDIPTPIKSIQAFEKLWITTVV